MAGHLEIKRAMSIDNTKYLQVAQRKILNRLHYAMKRGHTLPRVGDDIRVFGKKFLRLPDEYAQMENEKFPHGKWIAFHVGSYPVSKRTVHGGLADFELHYNTDTKQTVIYMVA